MVAKAVAILEQQNTVCIQPVETIIGRIDPLGAFAGGETKAIVEQRLHVDATHFPGQRSQKADRVTFLPDGNGDFTDGMGLLVGKEDLGFGKRSWRYSILVRDGAVEKMFIEPDEPGDPFAVSDADTMLAYLDPNAERPHDVTVFSRPGCAFCARAKGLLRDAGIEFEELVLNRDYTERTLRAVANATGYPQVFIAGQHIGGADKLQSWLASSEDKAA